MKLVTLNDLSEIISYKIPDNVSEYKFVYNFISVNREFILETCSIFSDEDLWYSEYYYIFCEKCLQYRKSGYDAGFEQMVFKLLEAISNEIDIDWDIINNLEIKAKKLILE